MFHKQFEVRWSDSDANGHMANSAYLNFMSHVRMAFFGQNGFSLLEIKRHGIGPVVFFEHMHYFKESFAGDKIDVSVEVSGLSADGMFFEFEHNFYNEKGKHLAFCHMQGGWIDLKARKLTALPESLLALAVQFPKTENFKTLTKEAMRAHGRRPKDREV